MEKNKREWTYNEHKEHSPQFKKGQEHQDEQHQKSILYAKINIWLAVGLCILSLVLGGFISWIITGVHSQETNQLIKDYAEEKLWEVFGVKEGQLTIVSESNLSEDKLQLIAKNLFRYAESEWDFALAYLYNRDYNKSLEHINIAITYEPSNAKYLLFKGNLLYLEGDYNQALEYLSEENLKNQYDSILLFRRANALSFIKNYSNAIEEYKKLGENCEGNYCSAIYALIAYTYYAAQDYSNAKTWIDKTNPSFEGGEYIWSKWSLTELKADIYLANGYYEEAKEYYEKLFRLLGYNVNFEFKGVQVFKNAGKGYCSAKAMLGELGEDNRCIIINPSTNEVLGEMTVNK